MLRKLFYLAPFFLIMAGGIYLNRAYAHVYSYFYKTSNPNQNLNYTIGNTRAYQTIRYAALGDSLTAGVGADNAQSTFPYLLAEKIAGKTAKVKLLNLGQPGAKSIDLINNQLMPLSSFRPDTITLCIGTNDMHNRVPLDEFEKNYRQILDELEKYKKAKIIIANLPYLGADNLIWPPYRSYFDGRIKQYNQVIDSLAKEKKLTLVNLYDKTKEQFKNNQKGFYSVDFYHPSTAGYRLWNDLIYASYR